MATSLIIIYIYECMWIQFYVLLLLLLGSIQSRAVHTLPNAKDFYPLPYIIPCFWFSRSPSLCSSMIVAPIGRLPRWRIGECSPDKNPGRTKVASAALQEDIALTKARGRKPRSKITWSSRLGVRLWASNPSPGKIFKS